MRARLLGQFFDAATGEVFDAQTACVFINQVRQNMDAKTVKYNPFLLPGGESKNHAMSVQVLLAHPLDLEFEKQKVGLIHRGKTTKNKTYPPRQQFTVPVRYAPGCVAIDSLAEIVDISKDMGFFSNKDGKAWVNGWCYYGETRLGNGREQVYNFLAENQDLADELESKVRERIEEARHAKAQLVADDGSLDEAIA